ncbi:hypothetical protein F1C10_06540 [Sphingomonas sp. NBWT7]|uniref:hypothetical protein n=1 Tax=Sphingomonas sp. NBWT7 TaxID=2596913 RepID=UPI0016237725|nr:hypothetical protein [Sphingomonas sp. NBWT7]QNE31622.1 hypothetical protein F1C10_06540 [Sphingomonas sp. NBWT7]
MKSHRKSRNAVSRIAAGHVTARGRASLSRGHLYHHFVPLTGRSFRRANRRNPTEAAPPNFLVGRPDRMAEVPIAADAFDQRGGTTDG